MVVMATLIIAQSALKSTQTKENLVPMESLEHVDLLDLQEPQENLVMMPNAILADQVLMVNLERLADLEMMVYLEDLEMMVDLEVMVI